MNLNLTLYLYNITSARFQIIKYVKYDSSAEIHVSFIDQKNPAWCQRSLT